MVKHGEAKTIDSGQFAELASRVIRALPQDIPTDIAQEYIEKPEQLKQLLHGTLIPLNKIIPTQDVVLDMRFTDKSIDRLLESCKFDIEEIDKNISVEKYFPHHSYFMSPKKLCLMSFGRKLSINEMEDVFERNNMRFADVYEILTALSQNIANFPTTNTTNTTIFSFNEDWHCRIYLNDRGAQYEERISISNPWHDKEQRIWGSHELGSWKSLYAAVETN